MTAMFDYDVFLSFASSDEEIVKPLWQELCLSGLRVFWSDAALKKELGNSWFETIEASLDRSRHMILVCSSASMKSTWVQREYRAFLNHCYLGGVRRLVPILIQGYQASSLPLFLRELQSKELNEPNSLQEIISLLGGVNIEELRKENQSLKQRLELLLGHKLLLEKENHELKQQSQTKQRTDGKVSVSELISEKQDTHSDPQQAFFEILRLSPDASSYDIYRAYIALKKEYYRLLDDSPKRLQEICEQRLKALEDAFRIIHPEKKRHEEQKISAAFELLQLPEGSTHKATTDRYEELKQACLNAVESSDYLIKEAAAEELSRLEEAFLILAPEQTGSGTEVVMPQMGEQIIEGTITKWLKQVGDRVERDEPLFEISTDKVDAEIPSPVGGTLKEILFLEGETVPINTTVALIG